MISFHPHRYKDFPGASWSESPSLGSSAQRTASFAFKTFIANSKIRKGKALAEVNQVFFCTGELGRKEVVHPLRVFMNLFFPNNMETAKLSTNIKQNYAKQCTCQQKELGHLGGRLIWSLSDCILLYLFILNYSAFWKSLNENSADAQEPPITSFISPWLWCFFNRKHPETCIFQDV